MCQPVIIIGAARSGTNMLRDCLTALPGLGTWPCDEINYIWRHGNARYPTDEFAPEQATEAVRRHIRGAFDRLAKKHRLRFVVEKTCANSLRVGFVDRALPGARFVSIVRDGRDVVASAMKRWTAPLDLPYLLAKARYVPVGDLPYYAGRYLCNRAYRLLSRQKRLAFWGPRFEGMNELLRTGGLPEVCAAQWARSVQKAGQDLERVGPGRVHRVRYEDFVAEPAARLGELCAFLGADADDDEVRAAVQNVSAASVGKWKTELDARALSAIDPIVRDTLARHRYV